MKKIKFPILKGKKSYFPQKAECPWCRRQKVLEPHSFATFGGGALLKDKETGAWAPSDRMKGYFDFGWHGCHPEDGGSGEKPNTSGNVSIAYDVAGGQFDIYFCSTKCLREFLNYCVDELEQQIETNDEIN